MFIFSKGLWLVLTSTVRTERVVCFQWCYSPINCQSNRKDMASRWTLQFPLRVPKESTQLPSCIGKSYEWYVASGLNFFALGPVAMNLWHIQSYHIHVSSSLSRIDLVTFWIFRLNGLLCCHGQPINWFYIRSLSHRGHCTTCVAILKNTNIRPIEASGPQCSSESRKFWRENVYMYCNMYHPILFLKMYPPTRNTICVHPTATI